MEFKDYYELLGVTKRSTPAEIKKSFRKLARKYHPDVNPGDSTAEARFKEINEAYEVLGDAEKRRKYDALGANWRHYEQAQAAGGAPFGFGGAPPAGQTHWNVSFGGAPGSGFRPMSEEEVRNMFGANPFSDFFQTFFGGSSQSGEPRPKRRRTRGRDVEHALELSLDEAFQGVTQRLSIRTKGHPRSVEVRIPPGVTDGSRVRVAGEGEPGTGTAAAGDLYLRVRLRPHPQFRVKGGNLHVNATIPLTTAVLGGQVDVDTLDGKSIRLKIPTGTQPGQVFRLKGKGMPSVGGRSAHGDLYATAQITVPKRLSAKARRHYEALARLAGGTRHKERSSVA